MTGDIPPGVATERCPLCKAPASSAETVKVFATRNKEREQAELPDWLLCPSCQLMYKKEMPDDATLERYYLEAYREPGYPTRHDRAVQLSRSDRIIYYMRHIGIAEVKRALDYGCANGVLLDELRNEYGCEVVGVELNPTDSELAKGRKIEVLPRLEDVKGTFDVICLIHVLEHMKNPVEFLEGLRQYAEEGCHIVFEMPGPGGIANGQLGAWTQAHMTVWRPTVFPLVLAYSGWTPTMVSSEPNASFYWASGRMPSATQES